MKLSTKIRVIRVDPHKHAIASIVVDIGKSNEQALRAVKRVLRADTVGHQELLPPYDGAPALIIAGALNVIESTDAFRLRGCEDHAGIGILFSRGPGGGMIDVHVDAAWVSKRIVWIAGETPEAMRARALGTAPLLDKDLRAALLAAVDRGPLVAGDGTMWLLDEHEHFAGAMLQLGLGDEPTRGQRLTKFGEAVLDIIKESN